MTAVQQQINALVDELNTLKSEVVQLKASHATMHQGDVESRARTSKAFEDSTNRMLSLEQQLNIIQREGGATHGAKPKPLIEPKNVQVDVFQGAITDSRAKFLTWGERVRDRATLYHEKLCEAM